MTGQDKPKPKPKRSAPKRVAMLHPKMRGQANVLEDSVQVWLDAGWHKEEPSISTD